MTETGTEATDLAQQMNAGLEAVIPVAYGMGVRFTALRRGYAETTVPFEGNGKIAVTQYVSNNLDYDYSCV